MPERSIEIFLQQGLLGAICVVLLFAIWQLFRLYTDSEAQKIVILREALQAASPLAEAIRELTRSHETLADKIERLENVSANRRR